MSCDRRHPLEGMTLVELAIILAVVGILVALAAPLTGDWSRHQRLNASVHQVEAAFSYARSEAIRTGNVHAVFFEEDAAGNSLDSDILVLDDGRPGSPNQDCDIDAGEPTVRYSLEVDVSFGVSQATAGVATDPGPGSFPGTATFVDAAGNDATWVLFRPEGMPLAFSSDCSTGAVGSGGGGVYLTNGERDAAVLLTALGATRKHKWDVVSAGWTR